MRYELTVSLRYLLSKRRQTFVSLITLISTGGVAVGVMVLIVVLAVMSGFEASLKEKILGINAHLWILPQTTTGIANYREVVRQVRALPHVVSATPFTTHEVMLMAEGRVAGALVRGVDPHEAERLAEWRRYVHGEDLTRLLQPPAPSDTAPPVRGIVLGQELARTLLVFPGQELIVNAPLGLLTPAGLLPNMRKFTVTGTFATGMYEYDAKLALIALSEAQALFDMGDTVHGIEVRVDDIYRVRDVAPAIRAALGPQFWTRDWMQMNRTLFAALRQEKVIMFIILVLIILVAAFNIVSTLMMMVMERGADIAILKAMGARNASIRRIFVLEGLIIGTAGTVLGGIAGLVFTWNLQTIAGAVERLLGIQFFPPDVYFLDQLPARIEALDVGLIALTALGVSFLATLYPAWNASRLDPVVALRYE
ncbi:MAG: ABC transporter permease [Candidatus Tectimicrobiota bacterium]|nr:MAG: ABC transporter permease [Candidatus Tectomicrobia bacterium]